MYIEELYTRKMSYFIVHKYIECQKVKCCSQFDFFFQNYVQFKKIRKFLNYKFTSCVHSISIGFIIWTFFGKTVIIPRIRTMLV